ncbi:MAG: class I SAM-dependent methyltransferase [Thermoleophilia bacterium]|nr:class I SAM-dependent methyltransferase [Thermoleophilia bacterium]
MIESADAYASIAEIYDAWCLEVQEDIGFYVGMALGTETKVVELAAGTGRIAIPLAESGYDVVAVDRSQAMLGLLTGKAAAAGVSNRIDARLGDLTRPGIDGLYDRVVVPFRSLLHLGNDEERLGALRAARALLTDQGYLAFDVFSPTPDDVQCTQGVWCSRESGARERADWYRADGTTQIEVEMRGRTTTLVLHPLPAARWLELVEQAGFEVLTAWGDFNGAKVRGDGTGDLVVVAQPV